MIRFAACFSAVLLSCTALAQVPSPSPAPVQVPITTTSSPDVQQFQKIENDWAEAVNRRDQYALEIVLSPLFLDVSGSGDITTRNQQLDLPDHDRGQDAAPRAEGHYRSHARETPP